MHIYNDMDRFSDQNDILESILLSYASPILLNINDYDLWQKITKKYFIIHIIINKKCHNRAYVYECRISCDLCYETALIGSNDNIYIKIHMIAELLLNCE